VTMTAPRGTNAATRRQNANLLTFISPPCSQSVAGRDVIGLNSFFCKSLAKAGSRLLRPVVGRDNWQIRTTYDLA
jgi:hypothetical protein